MGVASYRIQGVLGRGAVGVVYAAQEVDGVGRDVAIKVLSNPDATDDVVRRFRDEARLLSMLRDRALIRAAPPARLGDGWAIVMDLVEGADLATLVHRHGPLPPRAALEVVGEVARALDRVWRQPGPDGEPLQLVHRDLKPANLILSPDGQVHLLDLGIARAQFGAREARTTKVFLGTPGFIAPERLTGDEGPKGDVFSLGRVLRVLTSGRIVGGEPGMVDPLASELCAPDPDKRPTMREVSARCAELAATVGGPRLAEWAFDHVPPGGELGRDDPRVDTVVEVEGELESAGGVQVLVALVGAALLVFGGGAIAALALALTWWWLR